jgi:GTP pyrophosphokinase
MNGAFTYLAPARSRRNLTVRANSPVDRVHFEDGRAIGVRLVNGSEVRGREIMLCAGTYGSPAILLRSGIGPAAHLLELGIPITQHLPGVGENLLDHPLASPDRPRPRLIRPEHAPRSRSFIPVLAKARSRHAGDDIDLHVYIGQNFDESFGAWFLWITASLQFARSQGRVRLTSADPMAPLDIDHAYLSDPADLEALCDGIELVERIIASAPMQRVLEPYAEERPPWGDAGELPAWALSRFGTTFHPSSTCRMGPASDPMAVVDHDALVHGVAGLRVVDASIFPSGPRANIHFTVVAVAEKLADAIRHQPASGHLEAASPAEDLMRRFKDFNSALKYASRLHATQTRKGSDTPYISHLLAVAAIALEHGATEKEATAALLHDAVEDQGGQAMLDKIRRRYGKRVARIVAACSDTDVLPKPPWRERKEAFVERLRSESYSVRLVVAADKLHNVRDVLRNYRIHGDELWSHFKGGRDGTLWYYSAVVGALTEAANPEEHQLNALIEEIGITLSLLEQAMSERSTRMHPAELA